MVAEIGELVLSGFISKTISDSVDKYAIKKADNNRKEKHQDLQTRMYQVMIDAINRMTYNQYKKQDILYDVAERLLKDLKSNKNNNIEVVKSGLSIIFSNVDDNKCNTFVKILCNEISKEANADLYKEILLIMLDQRANYSYEELQQINTKLEYLTKILNEKSVGNDGIVIAQDSDKKFQNNKKQEYIDNWNGRLFLHQDNEERPLTLANAFIMPCFHCNKEIIQIEFSDKDTLEQVIEKFIIYNRSLNMFIKGVPGIGKTSIISWIANKYKDDDRIIILRFRDWEKEDLKTGLLKAIYNMLRCKREDLNNKILILDGFDEIKSLNVREQLVYEFFNEVLDIRNIKIIITSRLGYLDSIHFQNEFELLPFDKDYIKEFYWRITGIKLDETKIDYVNLDVLGIPVILYMAIMSGIDITERATKSELYNRIFTEEQGIFDRFSYKGIAYDEGSHLLRDKGNIRKYLKFLREVAFKMFEKNDLSLKKKEYQIPKLEFQGNHISILEFPIKYFFENVKSNIEFVHKSIYEYFVSEYIFVSLCKVISMSKKKLASFWGNVLKNNNLSWEIVEFLKFKVRNSKLNEEFDKVNEAFQLMLHNGMTYYTKECLKNVIQCEINVFVNMIDIIHLWENWYLKFDDSVLIYLRFHVGHIITNTYLSGMILEENIVRGLDLREADLRELDLGGIDLRGMRLNKAKLNGASLGGADLRGTDLREALFDEKQINYLEDKYDLRKTQVYIQETNEIITYEEYCNRRTEG